MLKGIQLLSFAIVVLTTTILANDKMLNVTMETPHNEPFPYVINIVGTFNQWSMDKNSRLNWNETERKYQFMIPLGHKPVLFNLYKEEDWQNPLATESGKPFTCGFINDVEQTSTVNIKFHGWAKDKFRKEIDTVGGQIITIKDFPMKSLQRSGDIFIYLPKGYYEQQNKSYPVVYMLDGQNLFSERLSYSYEWKVDETLIAGQKELIVVGISNGPNRWSEYNPWDSVNYMGAHSEGTGERTIQFIKNELKPNIDQNYRTLHTSENTALIGSSLGGLMALYAAIEYGDTFGRVAALSPSFSFSTAEAQVALDPKYSNLIQAVKASKTNKNTKIYFDVGEVEYGSFDLVEELHDSFIYTGYNRKQLKMVKDKLGRHCELDWSKRLPIALNWLFEQK